MKQKEFGMVMSLCNDSTLKVDLPDGTYPLIYLNWLQVPAHKDKDQCETVKVENGEVDTKSLLVSAEKYRARHYSQAHLWIETIDVCNDQVGYSTGS